MRRYGHSLLYMRNIQTVILIYAHMHMYKANDETTINGTVYVHMNTNRFPRFICDALTINYFHTRNENCKYALFICGVLTF